MRPLIRVMRPGDWAKNVFVLPAVVFSERLSEPEAMGHAALAFAAFCLLSSGFYALNDVLDRESDRRHPIKRNRPVASGAVSPKIAMILGLSCAALGLTLGWIVSWSLVAVLLTYAMLQILYNGLLKRVLFVDVVTIAIGFSLRSAAGAVAIDVQSRAMVPASSELIEATQFLPAVATLLGLRVGMRSRPCRRAQVLLHLLACDPRPRGKP